MAIMAKSWILKGFLDSSFEFYHTTALTAWVFDALLVASVTVVVGLMLCLAKIAGKVVCNNLGLFLFNSDVQTDAFMISNDTHLLDGALCHKQSIYMVQHSQF